MLSSLFLRSAALFLKYINQLFENEFGIRGKATKLALDMNRDFAPTLENQMVWRMVALFLRSSSFTLLNRKSFRLMEDKINCVLCRPIWKKSKTICTKICVRRMLLILLRIFNLLVEKVLDRGDKIELLVDKSDQLRSVSFRAAFTWMAR